MVLSVPFLTHNKLPWLGSRKEREGVTSPMLCVPGGCLLANSPGGKDRASWGLGLSVVRLISPPPRSGGPASPLDRGLRETGLPWRPTLLTRRQGLQSALVGPPFLSPSRGGTAGSGMHSSLLIFPRAYSHQPITYKRETL